MWTSFASLMALAVQTITADLDSKVADSKIVGGFEIDLHQAPFLVSIQSRASHICGGAILTLSNVITACHCVSDVDLGMPHNQIRLKPVTDITVVAGTENIVTPTEEIQKRAIYDMKLHPNCSYKVYLTYDFAVAFLRDPLIQTPKVKPFNLVSNKKNVFDKKTKDLVGNKDKFCYVAGWGATVSGRTEAQHANPVLKAARMTIITDDECRKKLARQNDKFKDYDFIENGALCSLAYGHRLNDSDCNGDSGGPFFCGSQVYGLVSYGFECGRWDVPNVYAKLSFAVDWLQKQRLNELPRLRKEELPLRNMEKSSRAEPMMKLHKLLLLLRVIPVSFHLTEACHR